MIISESAEYLQLLQDSFPMEYVPDTIISESDGCLDCQAVEGVLLGKVWEDIAATPDEFVYVLAESSTYINTSALHYYNRGTPHLLSWGIHEKHSAMDKQGHHTHFSLFWVPAVMRFKDKITNNPVEVSLQ